MKNINSCFSSVLKFFLWWVFLCGICVLSSCREEIDDSDLYTFTGETASSFISKDSELSHYNDLLHLVRQSSMTESTVASLLSARGNYTCFVPVNQAVEEYLDTMAVMQKITDNDFGHFLDSLKSGSFVYDSIAKVIVYNSIIDCGNEEAYEASLFPINNGTFGLPNMNGRYLTSYSEAQSGELLSYYVQGVPVYKRDNQVENGYIHKMSGVIAPTDANVLDLLKSMENMSLFANLLVRTGWDDSITRYIDEDYEQLYATMSSSDIPEAPTQPLSSIFMPEHRKFGYTIFAETDDVYQRIFTESGVSGRNDIEKLVEYLKMKYGNDNTFSGFNWGTSDQDLKDPMNVLNQFVSYHILPVGLSANQFVVHYNEYGFDLDAALNGQQILGIPVYEYYETMTCNGAVRRLMKITESKQSDGLRINRYVKIDPKTGDENVGLTSDGAIDGIKIQTEVNGGETNNNALNGYIYPIDELLVYSDNVTEKVLNERIRFDVASIMPELINLGYRRPMSSYASGKKNIYFPPEFVLQNMKVQNGSNVYYFAGFGEGWGDYQGDEFNISGNYDITIKLPPVPTDGTYEVRLGYQANGKRGMAQIYFGEGENGKVPLPEGIPLDLRNDGKSYGWEEESSDTDYNQEVNKRMRNQNHMKGPRCFVDVVRGNITAYEAPWDIRRIIVKREMKAEKTYYVRFKSVLDDTRSEFHFDYLELVPSYVFNNPVDSEDEW